MYTPKHFQFEDLQETIAFIRQYSFGTLVTVESALPLATHIPFTVQQRGDKLFLTSHIAVANQQSINLSKGTALAIFTEPHAYISPSHYEKEQNVPTWNYIAVHAYGKIKIIDNDDMKLLMLEDMIRSYDTGYLNQWANLSADYKLKMIKGIVAFEMEVTDLQGKKKLSQNRSETEKHNIINALSNSTDNNARDIARYMK